MKKQYINPETYMVHVCPATLLAGSLRVNSESEEEIVDETKIRSRQRNSIWDDADE